MRLQGKRGNDKTASTPAGFWRHAAILDIFFWLLLSSSAPDNLFSIPPSHTKRPSLAINVHTQLWEADSAMRHARMAEVCLQTKACNCSGCGFPLPKTPFSNEHLRVPKTFRGRKRSSAKRCKSWTRQAAWLDTDSFSFVTSACWSTQNIDHDEDVS